MTPPGGPLEVIAERDEAAPDAPRWRLRSPAVGRFVEAPPDGARLRGGDRLGALEVLGRRRPLVLPAAALGAGGRFEGLLVSGSWVAYGDELGRVDAGAAPEPSAGAAGPRASEAADGRGAAVRAPSSGRYYRRPAPEKPPFVEPGDALEAGQTVGLLEVMKTFTRIHYGGPGLPERAVVVELVAEDGAEVDEGAVLLRVEPS